MTTLESPRYADTIVVGGGSAGAAVAGLLAERGDQSVLLLEAGPDYGPFPEGRWPSDLLDGRIVAETHDWAYTSAASNGQPGHSLERARVIGGCSSHNGCIALWGSRLDYDGWTAAGNDGWSTEEVLPYFRRVSERLRVRDFEVEEVTPFHGACLEAMAGAGVPTIDDLNGIDENFGAAISPVNIHEGVRWNASFAYLDPVRDDGHLTVVGEALVNRVNLEGQRAVSVDVVVGGEAATVGAGRVVLCAGAYESPSVLMRSGVGAEDELSRLGIDVRVELAGVGENLHDHPAFSIHYRSTPLFDSMMDEFIAGGRTVYAEQSLAKARSSGCAEAFDLHIAPIKFLDREPSGQWRFKIAVANMVPRSRGRLTLRDADPRSAPIIDTGYFTDPEDSDIGVVMDGLKLTREIARQRPLAELIGAELEETARVESAEEVKQKSLHYYHPVGTCKMGPDADPEAVVDAGGKVRGLDNLYVADASIMPVVPRANTNLPAVMVAERFVAGLE